MNQIQERLRALPGVDRVLQEPALRKLSGQLPPALLTEAVQQVVARLRYRLLAQAEEVDEQQLQPAAVAAEAARFCRQLTRPSLRPVINATGTLLHTNLGRAPLAQPALQAIRETAENYCNLELDLQSGKRGQRFSHVEQLLCRLTGAEAALVVNNNAGAVLLALTALGRGREAIVSRGELVEIGGSFRVPEVTEAGGVRLREVGSSNRTHLKDYRQAICAETALLVKVHTSNYRIVGFTAEVPARELVPLAREHQLVLLEDLGSGMLFDLADYGLPREPTVAETVAAGVDVVTFSGDKLLGGPQAGIILGRQELLKQIRRHPLARALRIDKLSLAALEGTLRLYLDRQQALQQVPLLRMLAAEAAQQQERCQRLLQRLQQEKLPAELELAEDLARVGGGAMPLVEQPDHALAIRPQNQSLEQLACRLRTGQPAVMGRLQDERLLINLRAVAPEQEEGLFQALCASLTPTPATEPNL